MTLLQNQRDSLTNVSWLFDTRKDALMNKQNPFRAFPCMQRTIERDGVGATTGTVFQDIRPGAGFKTGNFVEEELGGGATAERLTIIQTNSPALRFDAGRPMQWLEGGGGEMLSFHA